MQDYRAFIMGQDGHIQYRIRLFCYEAEALRLAKQLVDGHDVELWQLDRRLATFEHESDGRTIKA